MHDFNDVENCIVRTSKHIFTLKSVSKNFVLQDSSLFVASTHLIQAFQEVNNNCEMHKLLMRVDSTQGYGKGVKSLVNCLYL
jgi:hypothetical protein